MSTSVRVRVISGVAASVTGQSAVTSVAGRTGAVTLTVADVSGAQAETASSIGTLISGAASKATPANADGIAISDSAASGILKNLSWSNLKAAISASLDGIFAKLAGLAGGQTLIGGTAASENLTLQSTAHATRGKLLLGSGAAYDEVNVRLGVGTQAPSAKVHVIGTTEQKRLGYDASNYYSTTVSSTGTVTHEATGTTHTTKVAAANIATLGSELITNGSFATDISGWTDSGSSWSWSSGKALHTAGSASTLSQSISVVSGETYLIAFDPQNRTAGAVSVSLGSVSVVGDGTSTAFFFGPFTKTVVANATGSVSLTITPTSDFNGTIDNVSVKQVTSGSVPSVTSLAYTSGASGMESRIGPAGLNNTLIGTGAGRTIYNGSNISAVGYYAVYSITTGQDIAALGTNALRSCANGNYHASVGSHCGYSLTSGSHLAALGYYAAYALTTAQYVTAIGANSLRNLTASGLTSGLGYASGRYIADGSTSLTSATNSCYIGASTKASADSVTNENVFGYNATGIGSNSTCIGSSAVTKCQIYGDLILDKTVTAAGTTGAQTINKTCGSVNFAASATSLVVTNNRVTTSSVIVATVATNDSTMKTVLAVPASGSFTLYANAAATAETRVNWIVLN